MQEQAGGEHSRPASPSIGTGYLCWVPVKLKQQQRLVSVAAVIAFNAGIDSFSKWRKWGGVEGSKDALARMAVEAYILEMKKAHAVSQWMDTGLDNFQSLPFPPGCGLDPSSHYCLLLAPADVNPPHYLLPSVIRPVLFHTHVLLTS